MSFLRTKFVTYKGVSLCRYILLLVGGLALSASARNWPDAVGEGSISRWNGDRVAAYTLTIDDNHPQDHDFWKRLGEQYGFNWTWFVITENVGSGGDSWADWQHLVDQGHGIGSHGLTDYSSTAPGDVDSEYADSQQALRDHLAGVDALTLAYPNGYKPPNDSALAAKYYVAARGVVGGVNQIGSINYTNTHSISMNATTISGVIDPGSWMYYGQLLNTGHPSYGGWYSVHFHSVLESMKTGVTNMLDALKGDEADIWAGTFQQVAQYAQEFENATLVVDAVSGTDIRFTVTDTLDNALFYHPLTVKIRVDSSWDTIGATQGGSRVPVSLVENAGHTYALVQAVPDGGQVTLQQGRSEGLLVVVRGASKNRVWVDGSFPGTPSGAYDAPFPTVQEGLDAAVPGDIVTVREGTYREQVVLPSGMSNQPITLSAAPGERVILNAMVPLASWQALTTGLYAHPVSWAPEALYAGFRKMSLAREPNEGWWKAEGLSEDASEETFILTDAANLTGLPYDLTNASIYIWTQSDDRFYTCSVVSFDPVLGRVEFENSNAAMNPAAGDKYWLQNQLSLIDLPGEWAAGPDGDGYRIYCWPEVVSDLLQMQVPPASGRPVSGRNVSHVRLQGLEVVGGVDRGIYLLDAQDVEINQCIVHNNLLYGLWMRNAVDCSVRNSIFMNNRYGLVCETSTNITVEANEIGPNTEDGLVLARNASDIWIRSNYIHDHMRWGHPDNAQTFLGVSGVHFIGNLMMTGGQSVMMEATTDGEFVGNMVVGSAANMVNFGHGNASNFVVRGNTLALSGYSSLSMSAQNYEVKENIFTTGHASQMYVVSDTMNYQGDRNLFWNGERLVEPTILVSDGVWGSGPAGPAEPFSIVYENNNVAAGDSSTPPDSAHPNISAGSLSLPASFPASNWPNALTALQNNAGINSLAAAISNGDFFTFTVMPDGDAAVSYSNLFVRVSLGANTPPAETTFTLLSSRTGFAALDGLAEFSSSTSGNSSMGIQNNLDLSGIAALQSVEAGTAIEFRLYAHNTGANAMTRIGIGHGFWTGAADDDLRLEGSVSVGSSGPADEASAETIYHTSLATYQSITRQDLNSANANPLFVNAPFGINVMDAALLDEATRSTFALRDANEFLVGDHIEINFDGVVRTVADRSGAMLTINPPLAEKPLKGYLIANWGARADFAIDLGLQNESPAVGLGEGGGAVGSSVSIPRFKQGDFDGDGRRDLPAIPADLQH